MSPIETIDTSSGLALLKRTNRKTLAISVLPDSKLELIAPRKASLAAILAKVDKRKAWIRTQRRAFAEMNAVRPVPRYVNGATHRYLGRQYRLKILSGKVTLVLLKGAYLHVQVPEPTAEQVKEALEAWYRRRAKEQFEKRLNAWEEWCQNRKLPKPVLRLRSMAKRWGSALKGGVVCLNPELVRAPSICVDYVIAHEICHLKHPDHGREFWSLLSRVMPDWRARKQRLEATDLWQ